MAARTAAVHTNGSRSKRAARFAVGMGELGGPGTISWGGYLVSPEYVPELLGRRALDTYERMRRSDPTSAALLRALKLPILGATWAVEPASAKERDVAIARHVEEDLFGMSLSWEEHLRHVLTHLDFGFYVAEIVWELGADGLVHLRKLAPRLQRTIEQWHIARDGGLEKITQQLYGITDGSRAPKIPVEKLLVFTNEKEGADFTGRAVLRPAYKPWFIKDQLERIFAISAERHGVGIPVIEVDAQSYNDDNVKEAEKIGESIGAHERGYVIEIPGVKFRLEGLGQGRALDVEPAIGRLSREILVAGLAQFLQLGAASSGSHALSEDQSGLFLRSEKALAAYIAGIHNRHLIPRLVDLNYPEVERYPRLVATNIETRDAEKLLNALTPAVNVGLITVEQNLENALRERLGLPHKAPVPPSPTPPTPAPVAEGGEG